NLRETGVRRPIICSGQMPPIKSLKQESNTRTAEPNEVGLAAANSKPRETDARTELIQTIRLLSRSHRRFTEEQKIKVFRSIVRTAHLSSSSAELELYLNLSRITNGSIVNGSGRLGRQPDTSGVFGCACLSLKRSFVEFALLNHDSRISG